MNSNSPEDRLLDELLQEQSHGPDEAFIKQIEAAVDAGPPQAIKRPVPRHYGPLAAAAGIAIAGGFWAMNQNSKSYVATTAPSKQESAKASEHAPATQEALDLKRELAAQRLATDSKPLDAEISNMKIPTPVQPIPEPTTTFSDLAVNQEVTSANALRGQNAFGKLPREYGSGAGNGLAAGHASNKTGSYAYYDGTVGDAAAPPATYRQELEQTKLSGFMPKREMIPQNDVQSGDRYGTFIDQPWKSPSRDPLSTFSIDVDTASYSNVRRMIREGREVPKDAVRIEEFINAFKYQYDVPKGDGPFAVGAALADCPWAPGHQLVRISIKGREIDTKKRPASNLVFLIDVSGSMQSPDKLPLLKHSMETMVSQLDERDRVAIVVYAGSEGVALPSTRLDEEGRAKVLKSLSNLSASGSTNGAAGIQRAYQIAMEQKIEGGVNRVILATDGDFNVGITGQESLVGLVKERAKTGVYLTVAGFGSGNLNDKMMDAITHDGNGNYFYIDSEREGEKVFLRNLSGTLVTIAKDVKIQVDFNPAKVGSYRLVGYSNRVLRNEDFNNDKVDAGDIGAGHTVTAFYELTPPGAGTDESKYQSSLEKPGSVTNEWLTVKLRYKHPDGDESSKIEFPLTSNSVAIDKADSDFQFATATALLGMKLRGMEEASGVSWDQVMSLAKPGLANDVNEDRAEFVELVKKLAGNPSVLPAPAEVAPGSSQR